MRFSLSRRLRHGGRAAFAFALIAAVVAGGAPLAASAANSPVTGLSIVTNFDGVSIPNEVDASANNGKVATNDFVGFSWSFVTARHLTNATLTQTLPAGWYWESAATGALTANLPAYQSTAAISGDGRTITATLSAGAGADITLGPIRAFAQTAADGSSYTPTLQISDADGSDSASAASSVVVVSSSTPKYDETTAAAVSVSAATSYGGVNGQTNTVRVTIALPAYVGQPNVPLPAGSQFTVTVSNNIVSPQMSGGAGSATRTHSGSVTTFTTTGAVWPGQTASYTVDYFWANATLPSSNTGVSYYFNGVSMSPYQARSTSQGWATITAGSAPGVGTWSFLSCTPGWASCSTLMNWNQAPNPYVALDARLRHGVYYKGALDPSFNSVAESQVTLISQWNNWNVHPATTQPLEVWVTAGGTWRNLTSSDYTLQYNNGGGWTTVPTWADVPSNATSIQVAIAHPWAAGLYSPSLGMNVPLVGIATSAGSASIYGSVQSPGTSFGVVRNFRMVGLTDWANFSVNRSSVTAPTVLRYTANVGINVPAGGLTPQQSQWIAVTQKYPAAVLDVTPVNLDPSWTVSKTFDSSGEIWITFTHGPVTGSVTLPPIVVDATLSPIAPSSGSVVPNMWWTVQNGTSQYSPPGALTTSTQVTQAQVIALTTSAAKRTVESGESPLSWTVGWSNFKGASQGLTYVVGVLPSTGDSSGSSFHGSIGFGDLSLCSGASGTTLEYTTDPAVGGRAADDPATVWTPVPGSSLTGLGATAVRVVIADFQASSSCSLSIKTHVTGNIKADRYAMSVFGKSAVGGSLPQSVPTVVDVVGSSISGRVVQDTAAAGSYNGSMSGFASTTVELLNTSGTVLRTTTTASDGSYRFEGLPSGQYRVRVVTTALPTGFAPTFAPSQPITVAYGEDLTTANFGFIVYAPNLEVTQSYVLPSTVAAGQTVQLTYTAKNTGNGRLSSVAFAGITLGTPTYAWPTATPGQVDPQQSVTVTVPHVLTQAEIDAGSIASSFTASGVDPVSQPISKTSAEVVPLAALAQLSVTKHGTFTGLSVVGAPVTWTIEATNSGAVTLSNVTVEDALPGLSALTYTWPSGGSAGTLAPGQKVTVTATSDLTAAQVAAGAVTNTASASGTTPQLTPVTSTEASATVTLPAGSITGRVVNDPTASGVPSPSFVGFPGVTVELRNSSNAVVLTTVTSATGAYEFRGLTAGAYSVHAVASTLPVGASATFGPAIVLAADQQLTSADLGFIVYRPEVTLSQSYVLPSTIVADAVVQVTYVVTNSGNGALTSVATSGMVSGAATPAWPNTVGELGVGEALSVTVDHVLTAAEVTAGSLSSSFAASGIDPVGQTTSGSSSVVIPITGSPSLGVSASGTYSGIARVGDTVTWNLQVTNTGTVTLRNVDISGTVPGLSSLQYTWPDAVGELAPGQSATATAISGVTSGQLAASLVTNVVSATARTVQNAPVTSPSVTATVTLPSGSIAGRVVDDPTESGSYGTGMSGFGGVTVELRSPSGLFLDRTTTAPDGSYRFTGLPAADYDVHVIVSSLPTGASATFGPSGLTSVADTAAVTGVHFGFILYEPSLTVTQTHVLPAPMAANGTVTVTYTFTNDGNAPLTGIAPSGSLLALGTPTESWPGTPGELAPGESATIVVSITLTQAQIDAGSILSTATADGVDPLGQHADDSTTVNIPLEASAALTVATTGTFTGLTVLGAEVGWTFTVTNTGEVTATDVTLTNSLAELGTLVFTWPAGGTAGVLAPGETATATATSALTSAQIAALEVTNTATAHGLTPQSGSIVSEPATATVALERAEGISLSVTSALSGADTAPGPTVTVGTPITWTYTVTNLGRGPVSNVQVVDSTGATATLVSPAGFAGVLDPGQTVTFETTAPALAGPHVIDAEATATVDSTGSPIVAQLEAADLVTVSANAAAYYSGLAAPAGGGENTGLAHTGLDVAPPLGLAALLLVLGVWFVAARRRRARHEER